MNFKSRKKSQPSNPNFSEFLGRGSSFYDKDEILNAIRTNPQAAAIAWGVIPASETKSKETGYSLVDLCFDEFKNGESVHRTCCPVCGEGRDRLLLNEEKTRFYCRGCERAGRGNDGKGAFDIFAAVQTVLNIDFGGAVNLIGRALSDAGYIAPRSQRTDQIKNAVNAASKGGVPVVRTASELATKPTAQPPAGGAGAAGDPPTTYKGAPILPVYLDNAWNIQPRAGAGELPKLTVKIESYIYAKSGASGPKKRAELFDDQGRRFAFYDDETGAKVTAKKIKNAPGFKVETADPYDLRRLSQKTVERILIVESEKTVNIVNELYRGTTIALALNGSSGAKHWGRFAERFAGRSVIVCADADQAGIKSATIAAESLLTAGKNPLQEVGLFFPNAPDGCETFDGYGLDDLIGDLRRQFGGMDDRVITTLDDLLSKAPRFDQETLPRKQNKSAGAVATINQDDDLLTPAGVGDDIDEREAIERRIQIEEARKDQRLTRQLESESLSQFDCECLKERTRFFDFALAIADKYNFDPLTIVFSCLTAFVDFSGQKFAVYEPLIHNRKNQRLFPRLHTVLLGGSNSGKTPIINDDAIPPIEEIELAEAERLERLRRDQINAKNNLQASINDRLEQIKEERETAQENGDLTPEKDAELKKREREIKAELKQLTKDVIPDNPHFLLDDSSGEGIDIGAGKLQRAGYLNGALVTNDEAASTFSISSDPRGAFTRLKFYTRLGEPGGALPNHITATTETTAKMNLKRKLTLGYLFGCHLEIFGEYLTDTKLRVQGYANRFFKFYLPDERDPDKEIEIDSLLYDLYAAPFNWLFTLQLIDDAPYIIRLDANAKRIFKQYNSKANSFKKELNAKGLTDEGAFLGKTNTYALSIAAGLKEIELSSMKCATLDDDSLRSNKKSLLIDGETMQLAADLTNAAIAKTLAAMRVVRDAMKNGPLARSILNDVDESVLQMIRDAGDAGVTTSPIMQKLNVFKKDKKDGKKKLEATLNKLRKAGLVKTDKAGKWGARYFIVDLPTDDQDDDQPADDQEE